MLHPEFLTPDEQQALQLTGQLTGLLARIIRAGGDPDQTGYDIDEMVAPIHIIQRAIGAQAAARAYPHLFRRLGATIHTEATRPGPPVTDDLDPRS